MHREPIELWQHQHVFNPDKSAAEKRTLAVVTITFAMMIVEIIVGWLTNSMALLADGWHMGTHAFALGVSLLAFVLARRHSRDDRFVFGTWKIEILGAYTSAVILGIVGVLMTWASVQRIWLPFPSNTDRPSRSPSSAWSSMWPAPSSSATGEGRITTPQSRGTRTLTMRITRSMKASILILTRTTAA